MNSRRIPILAAASMTLVMAGWPAGVSAAPVSPTFDSFGELSGATFGGSGIPADSVAISTFDFGGATITLGLTAHQRFFNPPLTNDGAGTFTALPGANLGGPGDPSAILGALWNVGYYMEIVGGTFDDIEFEFLYDFDAAAGTDEGDLGVLDFNTAILTLGGSLDDFDLLEDSQNMMFGFLADGSLPFITAPAGAFDADATGEYSFVLRAISDGDEVGRTAINVNVVATAVPEPATLAVLGAGLLGLGVIRRRRAGSAV